MPKRHAYVKVFTMCPVPLQTNSHSLVADNLITDALGAEWDLSLSSYIAPVTITSKASLQICPTQILIYLCKIKYKLIISTIYELLEIWLSDYSSSFGGNTFVTALVNVAHCAKYWYFLYRSYAKKQCSWMQVNPI